MELQAVKAPHIKEHENVRTMFGDVCLALIPLVAMSIYYYNVRALAICIVSVATCFISDIFCLRIQGKRPYGNYSSIITGLIIAISMPASVPYYVVITAGLFAIMVAKHPFGGLGNNIFNPSCAGIVFASICWKDHMTLYPRPTDFVNLKLFGAVTAKLEPAITSSLNDGSMPTTAINDMLFGNFRGPMGATCIIVILSCAIFLLYRKSISWFTPVSFAASLTVFSIVFTAFDLSSLNDMPGMISNIPLIILYEFCAGSALFAMIFIATDPVTTPTFWQSKVMYGLGVGFLTVFFRRFGQHTEGVFAAVLAMNSVSGFLDKLVLDYQMDNSIIKRFKERREKYHQSDEYVALLARVEGERQVKSEVKHAKQQVRLEKQTKKQIELDEKRKKLQEERERKRAEDAEKKRIAAEQEAERKRMAAEQEAENKRLADEEQSNEKQQEVEDKADEVDSTSENKADELIQEQNIIETSKTSQEESVIEDTTKTDHNETTNEDSQNQDKIVKNKSTKQKNKKKSKPIKELNETTQNTPVAEIISTDKEEIATEISETIVDTPKIVDTQDQVPELSSTHSTGNIDISSSVEDVSSSSSTPQNSDELEEDVLKLIEMFGSTAGLAPPPITRSNSKTTKNSVSNISSPTSSDTTNVSRSTTPDIRRKKTASRGGWGAGEVDERKRRRNRNITEEGQNGK